MPERSTKVLIARCTISSDTILVCERAIKEFAVAIPGNLLTFLCVFFATQYYGVMAKVNSQ